MSFISKTIRDRVILGKFWISWVLRTTPLRHRGKFRIFQILAAILKFVGNRKCCLYQKPYWSSFPGGYILHLATDASLLCSFCVLDANPWAKGWDGKVDSRGFRILSSQVVDLKYHLEEDIVHLLKKRIIYEDGLSFNFIMHTYRIKDNKLWSVLFACFIFKV